MKQRIEIFQAQSGNRPWMARYINSPEIVDLFGTNELPTPFFGEADPNEVKALVQKNNPEKEVVLHGDTPADARDRMVCTHDDDDCESEGGLFGDY